MEDIRAACSNEAEIFIDNGFRRGTDIVKVLDIFTSELSRTLAQLGVPNIAGLEKRHVRRQPFFRSDDTLGETGQKR